MISELRKSINSILFERVTSPFYGALLASWVIWNWKIIYLSIFVSESKVSGTKIDYIITNYNDFHHLVTFPILSTIVLLTLVPFISNGAYWLQLKFNKWKVDKKNEIENKQLLTIEQSIALRKELRDKEKEFELLLEKKEKSIESMKSEIIELENRIAELASREQKENSSTKNEGSGYSNDYKILKGKKKAFEIFGDVVKSIKETENFPKDIQDNIKEFFMVNDFITKHNFQGKIYFVLTDKGKNVYKEYFNDTFKT